MKHGYVRSAPVLGKNWEIPWPVRGPKVAWFDICILFLQYLCLVSLPLDSTSLGYNSGQGALSSADRPLAKSHAALVETCEFLADVSPGKKKSLEFEKRSIYSVSLSSTASEGSGGYRSRFSLPHVCVYVAWVGCLLTAVTAGVFTVLYGVRWVKHGNYYNSMMSFIE